MNPGLNQSRILLLLPLPLILQPLSLPLRRWLLWLLLLVFRCLP